MIDLSIVIPIHNEEPNLEKLYQELTQAFSGSGRSYEIIFVDDGSTDKSFSVLETLQLTDPRLRVIRFRRNFGQTAAFSAGFAHARGRRRTYSRSFSRPLKASAARCNSVLATCTRA